MLSLRWKIFYVTKEVAILYLQGKTADNTVEMMLVLASWCFDLSYRLNCGELDRIG
jgi:hypothetical protein